MAVVVPYNNQWKNPDFFSIAGTSSADSAWLDARKAKTFFFNVNMAASGTAVGTFSIQATEFPDLATGIVIVTPTAVWQGSGAAVTVTSGAVPYIQAGGNYLFFIENIPSYCRLHYVFGTAGAAITAVAMGRAT